MLPISNHWPIGELDVIYTTSPTESHDLVIIRGESRVSLQGTNQLKSGNIG